MPTVALTHDDLHPRTNSLLPSAELIASHHYYDLYHTPPYNPNLPGSAGAIHRYTVIDNREHAAHTDRTNLRRTVTLHCGLDGELFLITTATWSPNTTEFDIAVSAAETFITAATTGDHGHARSSSVEYRMSPRGTLAPAIAAPLVSGRPYDMRFNAVDDERFCDVVSLERLDGSEYDYTMTSDVGVPVSIDLPGVPSRRLIFVTQPEHLKLTTGLDLTRVFVRPLNDPTGDPIRIDLPCDTVIGLHTDRPV